MRPQASGGLAWRLPPAGVAPRAAVGIVHAMGVSRDGFARGNAPFVELIGRNCHRKSG